MTEKEKPGKKQTKKNPQVPSSSDESEAPQVPYDVAPDIGSSEDESSESDVSDLSVGDFVIVRFAGKKRSLHYIGLIDKIEDDEVTARFLKRIRGTAGGRK